jgi:hypothetical protein
MCTTGFSNTVKVTALSLVIATAAMMTTALAQDAQAQEKSAPAPVVAPDSAATSAAMATGLQNAKLSFKITKAGITLGTVEEQFVRTGDNYKITSVSAPSGALAWFYKDNMRLVSEGTINASGLQPSLYDFSRKSDESKAVRAKFDYTKKQIFAEFEGRAETFDLPVGTQDRLSSLYQFMFSVPKAEKVKTWMSQGKRAEQYVYAKLGEEKLTINATTYATVHYKREAAPGESQAELWLAKDSHYMPVRIVFTDKKGTTLEQTLTRAEFR